uniref:Chromosome 17 open reading frame 67 n=2 Tax=Coturnix japonica TaxID=93934 RepID=A0A8C2UHD9_COTJA
GSCLRQRDSDWNRLRESRIRMKQLLVFIFLLVLMTAVTDTSPILTEKEAKQILRTRREDRQRKAGFPDEPMREHMLYLQRLEQRSEEQFLEHWLNPHCLPHCNRDLVHPI